MLLDVTNIASVGLDKVRIIVSASLSTIVSFTIVKLIFCDVVPALNDNDCLCNGAVSYTHLTLPTIYSV